MCPFIETIRIENGKAVNMAFHNYRFNRTRRDIFECNLPVNLADFIQPGEYTERTRCRVEYQEEVEKVEYLPYTIRPVNSLKIVTSDGLDYTYKSTDREALNRLFACRGERDDILIVRRGLLTDTSIANIALFDGKDWFTPKLPLLRGTCRTALIDNGIIKENPTFVLLLGMCPTLGTTTSAIGGLGMGLSTLFVLICSNVAISMVKNFIPDKVRIPAFIVIIATFVTILQLCMQAYLPDLYETLGLFIPLIVVNCILLGRAEAFAAKHNPVDSFFDGLGIGLGFTFALTLLGCIREFLGTGHVFGISVYPEEYGSLIFILAPGAFIALGFLIAIIHTLKTR